MFGQQSVYIAATSKCESWRCQKDNSYREKEVFWWVILVRTWSEASTPAAWGWADLLSEYPRQQKPDEEKEEQEMGNQ